MSGVCEQAVAGYCRADRRWMGWKGAGWGTIRMCGWNLK